MQHFLIVDPCKPSFEFALICLLGGWKEAAKLPKWIQMVVEHSDEYHGRK